MSQAEPPKRPNQRLMTSLVIIESIEENGTEWGLSFDGHNPAPENYFQMINEETAFRLKDKLSTKFPPITRGQSKGTTN